MLKDEETRILELLKTTDPTSKEYSVLLGRLKDIKDINQTSFSLRNPIVAQAFTSLVSIGGILLFERNGVLTTKALTYIRK